MNWKSFSTAALVVLSITLGGTALSKEPIRLDASSEETAHESFRKMTAQLRPKQQEELAFAVLKINMDGVGSAAEMLADPELRAPTVARVRHRLANMTAKEIFAEADTVNSVLLVRPGQ